MNILDFFLSHVVSTIFANDLPMLHSFYIVVMFEFSFSYCANSIEKYIE